MRSDLLAEFGPVKAEIDYTAIQEGEMPDGTRAIVGCPTCRRNALPRKTGSGTNYIHKLVEYMTTEAGRPVTEVMDACYVNKPRPPRKAK